MAKPPQLRTQLAPYLTVGNAAEAIEFYKKAFSAKETFRMPTDDGKRLMHASLRVNGADVMLSDHFPEYGGATPQTLGGTPVVIHLKVRDADSAWQRAVEAGAAIVMPLADMFWGDRYGQLRDPYGHVWSIGAPIKKAVAKSAAKGRRPAKAKAKFKAKTKAKRRRR